MFKNIVMAYVGDTIVAAVTVNISSTDATIIELKRKYPTARILIEPVNMSTAC